LYLIIKIPYKLSVKYKLIALRDIEMSTRRYKAKQNMTVLFLVTVFVAQSCALQFFPIYLKYLNFSAIEVGVIRASQTWISMLLVPAWLFAAKQLQSERWKRSVISVFLIINITLYLCLTFLPSSSILKDVTHCHRHSLSPSMDELVIPHHDKQWDHFKPIPQVPSHTANTTLKKPITNIFHTNEVTTVNLSSFPTDGKTRLPSVIKQDSWPRVIHHDNAKQVNYNSNITSHNHSNVSPISSTKQNNFLLDITTEMPKNVSFFPNIKFVSSSTTDQASLPVTTSSVSSVTTIKHKLSVFLINTQSRTESNKKTFTLTDNEIELTQNPIFKETNYSSALKIHRPIPLNTSVKGESNDTLKLENYTQTFTPQYETGHTPNNNNIKAMFTLLNRTLSKIHSQHNKLLSQEKLSHERANSDEEQDDSIGPVLSAESDSKKIYNISEVFPLKKESTTGRFSPNYKIWQNSSHTSLSEPWNAHLKEKLGYFKQDTEEGYVPVTSERNNKNEINFHETWLPKHPVVPWAQHKYVNKYYGQGNGFKNVFKAKSDYSGTGNLVDISRNEQSTNRLQPDIVVRVKGSTERTQDSENEIKPTDVRLWGEYKNVLQLLRQYKSGRKMEQAGQKENSLPIKRQEVKELLGIRNMQKNMTQEKEFLPHERQLRRKRVSKSATFESQEAQQLSTNTSTKFTRKHSARHIIQNCDKRNTKNKRHKASQSSPYATMLNYRAINKSVPMQGNIRRLMALDSSESQHYNNDTDLGVEKVIMPWSNKNISMQLWNMITANKLYDYWPTTFSTVLLLAVFAEVFSKAVTVTSSQFLQCQKTVKASKHEPIKSQNCHQQNYTLLGWGLFGCPLLAALVLATECSYQPRVFLLFSASLFMLTLVVSLFLLQLPGKNSDWKQQDYENEGKQGHTLPLQR
jgi:hypothetical protein